MSNLDSTSTKNQWGSIARTTAITLTVAIMVVVFLLFGSWGKTIATDRAAVMAIIQKIGPPNSLLSSCQFSLGGEFSRCKELSAKLELLKGKNEEIILTEAGEIIGVNFSDRVVVVLRPHKDKEGNINLTCAAWPKKSAPLECKDSRKNGD